MALLFWKKLNLLVSTPSIWPSTIFPYLATWSREGTNITHLYHCSSKIRVERIRALAVGFNQWISWSTIVQNLIRVQKSSLLYQIFIVTIVKIILCLDIERCQVVVPRTHSYWALSLPWSSKRSVDVALIVYASPEGCTSWLPDCVCSCIVKWNHFKDGRSMDFPILESNNKYINFRLIESSMWPRDTDSKCIMMRNIIR